MDKNLKGFISISAVLVGILLFIFGGITLFYRYSSLDTYNFILYVAALFALILAGYVLALVLLVMHIYRKKRTGKAMAGFIKKNLFFLFPLVIHLSGTFRKNKDSIRSFFVDLNNILVESSIGRYSPHQVLVLLPHCLQDATCIYKVTNDIANCRRCGKCCIGDLRDLAVSTGVRFVVATGGTAARKTIEEAKPRLILSVACERDLTSGISDVSAIPVIGVTNDRKNGPCYNTSVDVRFLKDKLNRVLK